MTMPSNHPSVVFSVAGPQAGLADDLQDVLVNHGLTEEEIFYYKVPPSVRFTDDYRRDWQLVCSKNPFFVILYSAEYEASDNCKREYEHIINNLFPSGTSVVDELLPWALVSLGTEPRVFGGRTPNYAYIPGYGRGNRIDRASIIMHMIVRIQRTRPKLLRDDRGWLLEKWHGPAFSRWKDRLKAQEPIDSDERQLFESSIALATSVGFGEQLGRSIRVVDRLWRLHNQASSAVEYLQVGESGRQWGQTLRNGLRMSIQDLIYLFEPSRTDKDLLGRLFSYLIAHTDNRRQADADDFVTAVEVLHEWVKPSKFGKRAILKAALGVQSLSLDFTEDLLRRVPEVAERHSKIIGPSDRLIWALDHFGLELADRLKKRAI